MNLRLILGASICLNIVLAALSLVSEPGTRQPTAAIQPPAIFAADGKAPGRPDRGPLPTRAFQPVQPPPWNVIQSDDLHAYVRNMRFAGFPEPIVQSIIIAELDRALSARRPSPRQDTNYWRTGPQRDAVDDQQRRTERKLESERRAMIKDLLGVEWYETPVARNNDDSAWYFFYLSGNAAADKADRLDCLWAKLNDQGRNLKASNELNTPERDARRRQAYREAVEELRRELGPAGFEELELRAMAVNVGDVWGSERLFGCVMTGQELRELLRIKKAETLPLGDLFDVDAPKPSPELTASVEERIRALLGEDRFQGYLRAKDSQFRWIHGSVPGPDASMELTWAVYDLYAGLKAASQQVQDQAGLTDEQRRAALRQLRATTEQALATAIGPEKYANHMAKNRDAFAWLNDLTVQKEGQR